MPNANSIVIPGQFTLYTAPVGTAAPADAVAALAAGWTDLGYTTEDGSSFSTEPSFEEVRSHQSDYPTRLLKTGDSATIGATLQEFSRATMVQAFGGGTITTVSAGQYRYDPPGPGGSTPTACIMDWQDGTAKFRLVIPKARARAGVELGLEKTNEAGLPLSLSAEGQAGQSPWYLLTNSAAFA